MAKLIYQDPDSGQEVSIDIGPNAPEVTIGRNPGNTIRVNNPSISRKHAKLVFDAGQVTLYDLNSSNGSYVNGTRIQNQSLSDGDRIRTGEFPLDFVETVDVELGLLDIEPIEPAYDVGYGDDAGFSDSFGQDSFGQDSFGDDSFGLGEQGATSAGASEGSARMDAFGRARTESALVNHLVPPAAPQNHPQMEPDFYGADSQDYDDDVDVDYGEPLMLDDADFEEVMAEAPEDAEPSGTDLGIRPYREEEDDEAGYFDEESGFYQESADSGLEAQSGGGPISDADDTLNAPLADIAQKFARNDVSDDLDFASEPIEAERPAPVEAERPAPVNSVLQFELEELRAQVERLEAERGKLIAEIESNAGDPTGAAERQAERLRTDRNRLSEERRSLIRQIKEARAELDERPQIEELAEAKEQIAQARAEVADLKSDLNGARRQIAERDQSIESLQDQVETITADFDEVQQRFSKLQQEKAQVSERGEHLDDQLSETQHSLEETRRQYEQAEETIAELQADISQLSDQRDDLRQQLDAQTETVEAQADEIDELKSRRDAQDAEIDRLTNREAELQAQIGQLEDRVQNLSDTLDARPTESDVAALQKELSTTSTELSETTAERNSLLAERAELQAELAQTRELLSDLQERLDTVSAERDEFRRERDAHKQEKQAFARETDYLQSNRRKWVDQIESLEEKVAALEADRKKKKTIFADLSGDLRSLVQQNEALKADLEAANNALSSGPTAEDMEARAAEIAQLEESLGEAKASIEELEADSSELTRQLGEVAQERDALGEALDEAKAELGLATAELAEKIEALNSAAGSAVDLDAIYEAHQAELDTILAERDALVEQVEELEDRLLTGAQEGEGGADATLLERIAELESELNDRETTLAELILARDRLEDQLKSHVS